MKPKYCKNNVQSSFCLLPLRTNIQEELQAITFYRCAKPLALLQIGSCFELLPAKGIKKLNIALRQTFQQTARFIFLKMYI